MRTAAVLAGCLLLGSVAAQDPTDPKPDHASSVDERMQQLTEMREECIAAWRKEVAEARKAKADGDGNVKAVPMRPDFAPIAAKAMTFAKEFAGKDEAVPFLMMVVQMDRDAARGALDTLMSDHIDSPKLSELGGMIQYLDRIVDADYAKEAVAKLLKSKNADVRGWALFAKHKGDIEKADRDGETYKNAKKALLAAAEAASGELAGEIQSAIDDREKFGIGCVAPDIVGIDLDGVEFKLSDYKGKVIFLDFWGDW